MWKAEWRLPLSPQKSWVLFSGNGKYAILYYQRGIAEVIKGKDSEMEESGRNYVGGPSLITFKEPVPAIFGQREILPQKSSQRTIALLAWKEESHGSKEARGL